MESVKGKNILVTGASGGIGSATARLLAGSGATLFLAGRKMDKLQQVALACQVSADRIFEAELSNENEVIIMADAIHAMVPQLDILINAAGIGIIKPLETLTTEDFTNTINANLIGSFFLVKTFLPKMKEVKRGLINNIPGVLGKVPMFGAAAYSASKYGLVGMMQSIREELKRTEIRITNIYLGGVDSPFWDTIDLRVQREKMIQAEEAAKAIWFLCQQPASAVVSEMVLQPFNHQAI
jgi:NADP-dependent 3-hydroxy acid dehydrogenase YdfG